MSKPEGLRRPPENATGPEKRESGPIRTTYEYRDDVGNRLCFADVELSRDTMTINDWGDDNQVLQVRRLLSFKLRGEKDGQPTEVDLLEMTNLPDVTILVSEDRHDGYAYDHADSRTVVPPLEHPLDVGVLFHELGHAMQHRDRRYRAVTPLYRKHDRIEALLDSDPRSTFNAVRSALTAVRPFAPEARAILTDPAMNAATEAYDEVDEAEWRLKEVDARTPDLPDDQLDPTMLSEVKAAEDALRAAFNTLRLALARAAGGNDRLVQIIHLPNRVMERDASRRALSALRDIRKKSGIDLLASHEVKQGVTIKDMITGQEVASDEGTSSSDNRSNLKDALRTHGAKISSRRTVDLLTSELNRDARRIEAVRNIIEHSADSPVAAQEIKAFQAKRKSEELRVAYRIPGVNVMKSGFGGAVFRGILRTAAWLLPGAREPIDHLFEVEKERLEQERLADEMAAAAKIDTDTEDPQP